MLLFVVDHAPRIAGIGVAALHFPMRSVAAHLFEAPDLRPLFVSPVLAACKLANARPDGYRVSWGLAAFFPKVGLD